MVLHLVRHFDLYSGRWMCTWNITWSSTYKKVHTEDPHSQIDLILKTTRWLMLWTEVLPQILVLLSTTSVNLIKPNVVWFFSDAFFRCLVVCAMSHVVGYCVTVSVRLQMMSVQCLGWGLKSVLKLQLRCVTESLSTGAMRHGRYCYRYLSGICVWYM